MTSVTITKEERFLLREAYEYASMIHFTVANDSICTKSLRTNFMTPYDIDVETLRLIGHTGAVMDKDFDSLFIPFRCVVFFFQAEDGIRDLYVTGVQTCALPISNCLRKLSTTCLSSDTSLLRSATSFSSCARRSPSGKTVAEGREAGAASHPLTSPASKCV